MLIREGFPGQRMLVVPRPQVREYLYREGSAGFVVTDCGYFPRAQSHGRRRPAPIAQAVVMACIDGQGWCETEAGTFAVERGEVVVLPPGEPHAYGASEDDPWTLWWFHIGGTAVVPFLHQAAMTASAPVRRPRDIFRVASLMTEVVEWMERDSTTASLIGASGAAWHTLTLLAADRSRPDASGDTVDHAVEYLRAHIAERVTVPQLAAMASLSASHFAALFRQQVGHPVLQYQTMLRMSRARELLDLTRAPVAEIAAEVGYPDSFYFARQFKKIHGVTPRGYRDQHKG